MSQLAMSLPDTREPTTRERWFRRIRPRILARYRGQYITTDEVWVLMEAEPEVALPPSLNPNAMGTLLSGWSRATKAGGYRRSERPDAHGNILTVWYVA